MRKRIESLLKRLGIVISRVEPADKYQRRVSLLPKGTPRGTVLLAYIIDPFLRPEGAPICDDHTHYWESYQIARTFLELGFSVDVISYLNHSFVPARRYDYFISARTNLTRIGARLNRDCVKVAHLDTAHWLFNNHAAATRLLSVQQRRGVTLPNGRMVEENWAIENADLATVLGNQFTADTYRYADKPIYRIPISVPCPYDWNEDKDFDQCRHRFLWFGSSGFVHKGLDLALEAIAGRPPLSLVVCGPFDAEEQFLRAFQVELYESRNVEPIGWVNVRSPQFVSILNRCAGLIYPSCSEGGGASALTCMHGGLIPIVSREASVDVGAGGVVLPDNSVDTIRATLNRVSSLPADELKARARSAWEFVRARHTREGFARGYEQFVSGVLLTGAFRSAAGRIPETGSPGRVLAAAGIGAQP